MSALLFNARTTDGNSDPYEIPARKVGASRIFTVHVFGTFNGATVTLEVSYDGSTYIAIPSASWTSASVQNLDIRTRYIRAVIASAGGSTSLSVWLAG